MDVESCAPKSELRPMFCEVGPITRSDGSCMLSSGDTTVVCAVYGPGEVKPSKELIHKACVDVVYRSRVGNAGIEDRKQEIFIEKSCSSAILSVLHPRTAVTVNIQEMHNGGGLVAACVNATCLALLDAGVPMRFLIACIHCVVLADGTVTLDPSLKQQAKARQQNGSATLLFTFESRTRAVISSHTEGKVTQVKLQEAVTMAQSAADKVFSFYRLVIARKFSKEL
eukprot:TRINITY_DN1625_c0_g1_i18.p1 TRINITY_DN1625_c0_g1~~TRINITY_DN1625_c0_g1_i18.p1  ORF type:complete len:226 (+),score=33.22 TRINITY_DN1625_c0_g1_i18:52-729(+)